MKLTVEKALELKQKAEQLKTDWERLEFAKLNNGFIRIILDNDFTDMQFNTDGLSDELEEIISNIELPSFDGFHGWYEPIIELFKFAGIDAESC